MTTSPASDDEFRIDQPASMAKRAFLAMAGLFCIVLPTWEFRHAFTQLNFITVFFGLILAGAYSVGIPILLSALFGEAQHWTFRDGCLHVLLVSPWRERTEIISGADILGTDFKEHDWDSRPPTYSVVLRLRSGKPLHTPDYGSMAKATEMRDEILRRLGLEPTR